MKTRFAIAVLFLVVCIVPSRPASGGLLNLMFMRGDVMVSLETGPVQWRLSDGSLNRTLPRRVGGTGEGMAFDAGGSLYVSRWCIGSCAGGGNTVERYDILGFSRGS